ncbi:MAG TPA: glycerophosphodiester phosphodiesterase family protein, partial [Verrucomicrobiae bacterium]
MADAPLNRTTIVEPAGALLRSDRSTIRRACRLFILFTSATSLFSAPVLSIGHRGNCLTAPENTLASFAAARGKVDFFETDAQPTADGVLVIMHDSAVSRTTDGTGSVSNLTLAQIKALDAGSWFSPQFIGERVPTMEEMITNTIPYGTPFIERKAGSASLFVSELRRLGVVTNVILQSFDWNFLASVHALEPALRLGALGEGTFNATKLASIAASGATIVEWEKSAISSNEVRMVHDAGRALYVWTVDGAEIQNFLDLNVDGIISDEPALVKQYQQPDTNSPPPFTQSLVAYWKMDDGLTNAFAVTVADSQGTNVATLMRNDGASHWADGTAAKLGGCLKVDGTNAFVSVPRTSSLDLNTNELTIAAWVKLQTLPSQLAAGFASIYDSTADCYVLYLDKTNKELRVKITTSSGSTARVGIPEAALQTNQWLHVAATFSGHEGTISGQVSIYLNGVPKVVQSGSDSSTPYGLSGSVKTGQTAA